MLLALLLIATLAAVAEELHLARLIKADNHANNDRTGNDVVGMVNSVWESVVTKHDYGLLDPRSTSNALGNVLTPQEAAYHYSASQRGIVDSARFLITFGIATELGDLQASALYKSVLNNDLSAVDGLLDGESQLLQIAEQFPLHILASILPYRKEISRLLIDRLHGIINVEATPNHGATALMAAACVNNVGMIQDLVLLANANVHAAHSFAGTTALHFAAEMGHIEAMEALLVLGANVEQGKKNGGTALHIAADSNRAEAVAWLLTKAKANPNALMNGDTTALYLASQRGHHDVVRVLVANNQTLVDFAMPTTLKPRFVGAVTVHGEFAAHDFYDSSKKNSELANGATALHVAAENGHLLAVQVLLEQGNAKQLNTMRGSTPLLIALQYNHPEIAMRLLQQQDHSCNVQSPIDGTFPLFVTAAGRMGLDLALRKMVELGCDVNLKNKYNATALSHALYHKRHDTARFLLKYGARVDITAIQTAAGDDDDTILLELLELYSGKEFPEFPLSNRALEVLFLRKKHVVDDPFSRAIFIASQDGQAKYVDDILAFWGSANVDSMMDLGGEGKATALYLASEKGHANVVRVLLRYGADPTRGMYFGAKPQQHVSPLYVACERGYKQLVELFLLYRVPVSKEEVAVAASAGRVEVLQMLLRKHPELAGAALRAAIDNINVLVEVATTVASVEVVTREALVPFLVSLMERDGGFLQEILHTTNALAKKGWEQYETQFSALHAAVIAYSNDEAGGEEKSLALLQVLLRSKIASFHRVLKQKTRSTGFTPLALAVEANRTRVVEFLLSVTPKEVIINERNARGETLREQAQRMDNPAVMRLLLDEGEESCKMR